MKELILTRDKVALIDDADYEYLNQWKWSAKKSPNSLGFYAVTRMGNELIDLGRFLLNLPKGDPRECDHIKGNSLDYRRDMIRKVNSSQNKLNQKLRSDNKFGCKGIKKTRSGRFQVQLKISKKIIRLGTHDTLEKAIFVRKEAEMKFCPDFVRQ